MTTVELGMLQQQMLDASRNVQESLEDVRSAASKRVRAETDFQKAWDRAYLKSEAKPDQARKSEANIETEVLKETFHYAQAEERTAKAALNAWQSVLSSLQSLASAHREEARLARVG